MQLGERQWTEIAKLTDRVVVLPLGAMEQHGHHLPVLTDTLIGGGIAQLAERELGDEALFLPPLWIGASDHHRTFPGTVSISNDVYVKMLVDILESLVGSGFRRIFMLNAHGGNITPGNMAMYEIVLRHREKSDLWLALSSWWTIAGEKIAALPDLKQQAITHADEWETSVILKLRPELVNPDALHGAKIPFESAFYSPDFSGNSRVDVPRSMEQLSASGGFGYPELASEAKGDLLIKTAAAEVVAFVREFATWQPIEPA